MNLDVSNQNGFKFVAIKLNSSTDEELIRSIKSEAKELSKKVNTYDPSHNARTDEEKYRSSLGGVLAEYAVKKYINDECVKRGLVFELSSKYIGTDQIDLILEVNGKKKNIEVRSSFFYKTTFDRLFSGAASIIGWYKTKVKHDEIKKDFYLFVIHFCAPEEIDKLLEKEVTFYIMGGASKELLEKIGTYSFLKQEGAEYCIINPVTNGEDAEKILNDILMQ